MASDNNNYNYHGSYNNNNIPRLFSRSFDTWSRSKGVVVGTSSSGEGSGTTTNTGGNNSMNTATLDRRIEKILEFDLMEQQENSTSAAGYEITSSNILHEHKQQTDDVYQNYNNDNNNNTTNNTSDYDKEHYKPRGSIRDVEHTWDTDHNFPVYEIQRIKRKTKKLRDSRNNSAFGSSNNNEKDFNDSFHNNNDNKNIKLFDILLDNDNKSGTTSTAAGSSVRMKRSHTWGTHHSSSNDGNNNNTNSRSTSNDGAFNGSGNSDYNKTSSTTTTSKSKAAIKAEQQLMKDLFTKSRSDTNKKTVPVTKNSNKNNNNKNNNTKSINNDNDNNKINSDDTVNNTSSDDNTAVNTTFEHETSINGSNASNINLSLHDLCAEAVSINDIAWRNALYLLSEQPELAHVQDISTNFTPLHVCCLNVSCTPTYIIRALLYVYPKAASIYDHGGRLPLHFLAAASSSSTTTNNNNNNHDSNNEIITEIIQMIIEEYPQAIYHIDDLGYTPLHLLLRNNAIEINVQRTKLFLGLLTSSEQQDGNNNNNNNNDTTKRNNRRGVVLQRRKEHLVMSTDSVNEWLDKSKNKKVITNINHSTELIQHEQYFNTYPNDVQVSLRKLAQWKHRRNNNNNKHKSSNENDNNGNIEVQLLDESTNNNNNNNNNTFEYDDDIIITNPAAIPFPDDNGQEQYPIHMLIQRAFIDRTIIQSIIDDDDDENNNNNNNEQNNASADMKQKQTTTDIEVESNNNDNGNNNDDNNKSNNNNNSDGNNSTDDDDEEEEDDDDIESIERQNKSPKLSVIHAESVLRLFATAYPEALCIRDGNTNMTPLLQIMLLPNNYTPTYNVIEILLGKRFGLYVDLPSWANDIPIHNNNTTSSSSTSSSRYMNPAMISNNDTGQLPLHIAAEEYPSDITIIRTIYESYPAASYVQDSYGRTPLHVSLRSYRNIPAHPSVIKLLLSDRVASTLDDYGKLPFDLLIDSAYNLPKEKPNNNNDNDTTNDYDVYYKLFYASIQHGLAKPDTTSKMKSFLPKLRTLPSWLRAEACAVPLVQDMLIQYISSPWKCSLILLDGIMLFILIIVFRIQMKQYVDIHLEQEPIINNVDNNSTLSSWYTYVVYASAIIRFIWLLISGTLATSIGEFQHLCLYNIWYWIDIIAMVFTIITSVLLYTALDDEQLLNLGTTSTILLWLALLGYISTWWHGMAVFVGGFTKIAYRIICPFIVLGILIIAFAQCFYTLLQLDCTGSLGGVSPVCSVKDSYRVVYLLLRGESLVDPSGSLEPTAAAVFLIVTFFAIFAVYILALFVTVLIAAINLNFDYIALQSFWEPKLAFIISADDLKIDQSSIKLRSIGRANEGFARTTWDRLVISLFGGAPKKKDKWYTMPGHSRFCFACLATFVLPIWFILGLLSLGLLWPPQVREWLFRPGKTVVTGRRRLNDFVKTNDLSSTSNSQISGIRHELMAMKLMSFEKSNEIHTELKELKDILYRTMQE